MMKINWKVRLKHKPFLVAMFSALILLVTQVGNTFGVDTTLFNAEVTNIFNAILGVLVVAGVVIDPVTPGLEDSKKALEYKEPGK